MKKINYYLVPILVAFSNLLYSQIITCNPALPTESSQVVITFDATQGNAGLLNYTSDVYAHTGVITNLSKTDTDWKYVIADWSVNTTKTKMTYLGNNKFQITISPSIRAFYGVPAGETIQKLAFVFRNADGSKLGKTASNGDIFYTVYAQGLSVDITSPTQDIPIYEHNSSISIQASSNNSSLLKLLIDNVEVSSTTSTSITYSYTASTYGKHWIKAIATYQTDKKEDSTYIVVRPPVTTEDLPNGLKLGVNRFGNDSIILVLNDPPALKSYCYVIGSFSKWMINDEYYMKRTTNGHYYWLTIKGLNPNKEYIYQYLIDGQLRLADPYCTKTSDPNDKDISSTNYPNLISYPKDSTTGIASTFKINEEEYSWNIASFTPPQKRDLVIYELHIRDFVSGDYIKTVMDSISYLKNLGVNAIELMPISEFEGNDSWGYNPSFYFAPDKAYGTKNDYKAFIDECHSQGIAVIMDIVLNHSYGQSPMVQMYYNSSLSRPAANNPWYNQTSPNTSYSWGSDFNHASVYTKQFVDSVLTYWLTEYKFDGFRFDFSKGFTNTAGDGSAYDASRIAILEHYADKIWNTNPSAYLILEHFCDNNEERDLANYGIMLWGNMNYNYNEATMGYVSTSDFSGVSYKSRYWSVPNLVGYMESHDEERLMYKNKTYGNSSNTSYNVKNTDIGLNRNMLAAIFFFTVPGPKMIWQFGELGYDISIDYNGRTGRKPIHWDYYNYWNEYNRFLLHSTYAQLIRLKENYDVFKTDSYTISFSGAKKWIKLIGIDMDAVVMGNFDVTSQSYSIDFPSTGKWYEYFTQDSIDLSTTSANFNFNPGEYRLYTSKRIISHDIFPEGIDGNSYSTGNSSIKIWPNPNNGQFIVSYNSKGNENVTVSIFSIVGQKVYEQKVNESTIGVNTTNINLDSNLSPGIYLVRLQTGRQISIGKIIVR